MHSLLRSCQEFAEERIAKQPASGEHSSILRASHVAAAIAVRNPRWRSRRLRGLIACALAHRELLRPRRDRQQVRGVAGRRAQRVAVIGGEQQWVTRDAPGALGAEPASLRVEALRAQFATQTAHACFPKRTRARGSRTAPRLLVACATRPAARAAYDPKRSAPKTRTAGFGIPTCFCARATFRASRCARGSGSDPADAACARLAGIEVVLRGASR